MQHPDVTWSPQVGDVTRIKETGRLGTVVKLKGTREPRFRLVMLPVAGASKTPDLWYGLDELEPAP
jgi:hypothetical protein